MWGISILADIRPMGYKLSCCGSLWSRYLRTFYLNCFGTLCGSPAIVFFRTGLILVYLATQKIKNQKTYLTIFDAFN